MNEQTNSLTQSYSKRSVAVSLMRLLIAFKNKLQLIYLACKAFDIINENNAENPSLDLMIKKS